MSLSEKQERHHVGARITKKSRYYFRLACIRSEMTQQDALDKAMEIWSFVINCEKCQACGRDIGGKPVFYLERGESMRMRILGFCSPSCIQEWIKSPTPSG